MGALDIGIDLGTTKIIIYNEKHGEILREPAIVAVNNDTNEIIAIGKEAHAMLGRTPGSMSAIYPLQDGVISDDVLTEAMLRFFIKKACDSYLAKYRVIICVPSMITEVERNAVTEAVLKAGGRKVFLIEEPIAAAIGAGIDISKPNGSMVVDIGGGTTDIAVLSLSGVVASDSFKYAGNKLDDEIIRLVASKYTLKIGKRMAEEIKETVGDIYTPSHDKKITVKGRNLLTGYPYKIEVSSMDIYEALAPFGDMIIDSIKKVLDKTPPELVSDIYENGIILTGGGSLLSGLAPFVAQKTNVKVAIAENPVACVGIGTSKAFDYIDTLQSGFSSERTYR